MARLSEVNRIRIYAVTFLLAAHSYIIYLLEAEKQSKIAASSFVLFVTALFLAWRGRSLRRRK